MRKMARKMCRGVTLRGITPTLKLISRMASCCLHKTPVENASPCIDL